MPSRRNLERQFGKSTTPVVRPSGVQSVETVSGTNPLLHRTFGHVPPDMPIAGVADVEPDSALSRLEHLPHGESHVESSWWISSPEICRRLEAVVPYAG